ncbi:hypothetical protein CI610_00130 [invertebrate metagenome]|uniref:Inner membrane protein n=1 Tax=invertebrate metagenome TaxID=1711999 RepID=A0A2H9TCA1_9ZZZZ
MPQNLLLSDYCRVLGIIALMICGITWWIDLSGIVSTCPFCRTERTVIGLLGVVMCFPHCRYLTILIACGFAAMGIHTASAQLLLHIKNLSFTWLHTGMAVAALFMMCGQLLVLFERAWLRHGLLPGVVKS